MGQITMIGLDLAKTVFQLHGVDAAGAVVLRRRTGRSQMLKTFAGLEPCLVAMEACGSAHYWARELSALGHRVKLLPPAYVKPFVKRGKSDAADAEAICEAAARPSMRSVPVKSAEDQAVLTLHKTRNRFVEQRTQTANTLRSLLSEFGVVAPQGIANLRKAWGALAPDALPSSAAAALSHLAAALNDLEARIAALDKNIQAAARAKPVCARLETIPGIGPVTASALAAYVPDARVFVSGRHFSAWTGLTPRQNSSGGKERLGAISKQGNQDLRRLLTMGATSALRHAAKQDTSLGRWLRALSLRKPARVVITAFANKLARIAWAVMARGEVFRAEQAVTHKGLSRYAA
jgi:transposase